MFRQTDMYIKCRNEQQFKNLYVKKEIETDGLYAFCVESESTVLGFPDVMTVDYKDGHKAKFYEFKYSNKNGMIKFQPTQPAFYRQHLGLDIMISAYNCKTNTVHLFSSFDLFDPLSPYCLNEKAEINLSFVERKFYTW